MTENTTPSPLPFQPLLSTRNWNEEWKELQKARRAADDTRRLYQEGRLAYLDSLDAERTLAAAEAALADSAAQLSRDQVDLFLSLGGGWEGSGQAEVAARHPVEP